MEAIQILMVGRAIGQFVTMFIEHCHIVTLNIVTQMKQMQNGTKASIERSV